MKAFVALTVAILLVVGASVGAIEATISGSTIGVPQSLAQEISSRYASLGISFVITGQEDRSSPNWYYYHVQAPGYLFNYYQPVYGFAERIRHGWYDTGVVSGLVGCPVK